jgi:hypothetical protein
MTPFWATAGQHSAKHYSVSAPAQQAALHFHRHQRNTPTLPSCRNRLQTPSDRLRASSSSSAGSPARANPYTCGRGIAIRPFEVAPRNCLGQGAHTARKTRAGPGCSATWRSAWGGGTLQAVRVKRCSVLFDDYGLKVAGPRCVVGFNPKAEAILDVAGDILPQCSQRYPSQDRSGKINVESPIVQQWFMTGQILHSRGRALS